MTSSHATQRIPWYLSPLASRTLLGRCAHLAAILMLVTATTVCAQQSGDSTITVSRSVRFKSTDAVAAQAPITLTLSRLPTPSEGRIAVVVGSEDLTSLFNAAGTRLVFRANGVSLPARDVELRCSTSTVPHGRRLRRCRCTS